MIIIYLFKLIFILPQYIMYRVYDYAWYILSRSRLIFYGWGIHLFTGKFGAGKTSLMVICAYKMCLKYPQLSILTNIDLKNFPKHTRIYKLENASDILHAPKNCIVLIDEIGTIFNSRDFNRGGTAVPKPLFQHLCQCRKRKLMIFATVQRYCLLDKQIRDISADVTMCHSYAFHPFTRLLIGKKYDIDDFDISASNSTYVARPIDYLCYIQKNMHRNLYNTDELINGFMEKQYLSDFEIMHNTCAVESDGVVYDKKSQRRTRRNVVRG